MFLRTIVVFLFAASALAADGPALRRMPMAPPGPEVFLQRGAAGTVEGTASNISDPFGDVELRGVTPYDPVVTVEQGFFNDNPAWVIKTTLPLWLFETGPLDWDVDAFEIAPNGSSTSVDTVEPMPMTLEQGSTLFDPSDSAIRADLDLLGAHARMVLGTNVTSFAYFEIWVRGPVDTVGNPGAAYVIRMKGARETVVQIDSLRGGGIWWESIFGFGPNVVSIGPESDITNARAWIEGSDFHFELTVGGNLPATPNPDLGVPEYSWAFSGSNRGILYTWTQSAGWRGYFLGTSATGLTMSHSGRVITGRAPLSALAAGTSPQWIAFTDTRIEKFGYAQYSTNILDIAPDSGHGDTETVVAPSIRGFKAFPERVPRGTPVSLLWSTTDADGVSIGEVGMFGPRGGTTVTPQDTTTYVMTATGPGGTAVGEVRVVVITEPILAVSSFPRGLLQVEGGAPATDRFVARNAGGGPETVVMPAQGGFFTVEPSQFSLAPGQSRVVQITSTATAGGGYRETLRIEGTNQVLNLPVRLFVAPAPTAPVDPQPQARRVDVSAGPGGSPSGAAVFSNHGTGPLVGVVGSTVPWIIPGRDTILIPPGGTETVPFTVDRSRRDTDGAAVGSLSIRYFSFTPGKVGAHNGVTPSTSTVRVIDTVTPVATTSSVPPLGQGETRHLLTGVGHLVGSVGTFLSDVSFVNLGAANLSGVESWFRPTNPAEPTLRAGLASIGPSQPLAFSDMIANVFDYESHSGTLHVRSANPDALAVIGTVLAVSDPRGNYGTTIPALRTDRGVAAGDSTWVPGVQNDDTVHTNLYLQEMVGQGATAVITSHAADGTQISSSTEPLDPFGMKLLQRHAPAGAAYFVVRNDAASTGQLLAYATPVDKGSGDTWSYTDWPRLLGYDSSQPMLIPIVGTAPGANDTFFRTGAGIVNAGETTATATLLYRDRNGAAVERALTLGPGAAYATQDLMALFDVTNGLGHVVVTPQSGRWIVNTRTYTTSPGSPATYGSATPTLPLSAAIGLGESRRFGAIEDASLDTVNARAGTTYRTNLGIVETAGAPVTVRVTMLYSYAASTTVTVKGSVSRDYTLGSNGLMLLNRISNELMGSANRDDIGDLTGLVLEVLVMDGEGEVVAFTSSLDNGTGDSILRVE